MNQEKIGKFIANCRREKNMTQAELASLLNITDRAISKWENGRGLPDISIIRELCAKLGITLNELLSGEKIKENNIKEISETNIINSLEYGKTEKKKIERTSLIIISSIMLIILTLLTLFIIDINRMKNDKPVLFSTWGYDYAPSLDLEEGKILMTIEDYITNKNDLESPHYHNEKYFTSIETFLIEEKSKKEYIIYAWILSESFYKENNDIIKDSGSSIPHKFTVIKNENIYEVIKSEQPSDINYSEDIKRLFPHEVRKKIDKVHFDGTIEKLEYDIMKQVKLYYHEQ